jgi:hypothetical protein
VSWSLELELGRERGVWGDCGCLDDVGSCLVGKRLAWVHTAVKTHANGYCGLCGDLVLDLSIHRILHHFSIAVLDAMAYAD